MKSQPLRSVCMPPNLNPFSYVLLRGQNLVVMGRKLAEGLIWLLQQFWGCHLASSFPSSLSLSMCSLMVWVTGTLPGRETEADPSLSSRWRHWPFWTRCLGAHILNAEMPSDQNTLLPPITYRHNAEHQRGVSLFSLTFNFYNVHLFTFAF